MAKKVTKSHAKKNSKVVSGGVAPQGKRALKFTVGALLLTIAFALVWSLYQHHEYKVTKAAASSWSRIGTIQSYTDSCPESTTNSVGDIHCDPLVAGPVIQFYGCYEALAHPDIAGGSNQNYPDGKVKLLVVARPKFAKLNSGTSYSGLTLTSSATDHTKVTKIYKLSNKWWDHDVQGYSLNVYNAASTFLLPSFGGRYQDTTYTLTAANNLKSC